LTTTPPELAWNADDDDARSARSRESAGESSLDLHPTSRSFSSSFSPYHSSDTHPRGRFGRAGQGHSQANLWRVPLRLAAAVHRGCDFARFATEPLSLPPADFDIVATPFATHETTLPLELPPDYAAALDAKQNKANATRDRLKDAKWLDPKDNDTLHAVAQAAFSKWLIESRAIRHVAELLALEDDRTNAAQRPLLSAASPPRSLPPRLADHR